MGRSQETSGDLPQLALAKQSPESFRTGAASELATEIRQDYGFVGQATSIFLPDLSVE